MKKVSILFILIATWFWGFSQSLIKPEAIELRGPSPYIDFSNDGQTDYDMRLILTGDDVLTIDGGSVGIGDYAPSHKLTVNGNFRSSFAQDGNTSSIKTGELVFNNNNIPLHEGLASRTESLQPDRGVFGVIGIATSSNADQSKAGAVGIFGTTYSTGGSYAGYFEGNLGYTGLFGKASDETLKENVKEIDSSLALLKLLRPKEYNYRHDLGFNFAKGLQAGFLVSDFERVFPSLVLPSSPPMPEHKSNVTFRSIDYTGLIPYLVKAIQEQQEIIHHQNERLDSLINGRQETVARETNADPLILELFPNPAKDQLEIRCNTNSDVGVIQIYDEQGDVKKTQFVSDELVIIALDSFRNGKYFVSLTVRGKIFDVRRLIISK